jgi:hypothetical protein
VYLYCAQVIKVGLYGTFHLTANNKFLLLVLRFPIPLQILLEVSVLFRYSRNILIYWYIYILIYIGSLLREISQNTYFAICLESLVGHGFLKWRGHISPFYYCSARVNPLNAELNPIRHLLAFFGAHHTLHISRIRVKTFLLLSKQFFL